MELFLFLFFGVTFIVALLISFKMDNDLHRTMPYARGYVIGYMCAVWPMALLAAMLILCFAMGQPEAIFEMPDVTAAFISLGIYSALGVGIIKRNRYMFLAYIILSFNLLAWIFLGIYLYRRWDEMKYYTSYQPISGPYETPKVEVVGKEDK